MFRAAVSQAHLVQTVRGYQNNTIFLGSFRALSEQRESRRFRERTETVMLHCGKLAYSAGLPSKAT